MVDSIRLVVSLHCRLIVVHVHPLLAMMITGVTAETLSVSVALDIIPMLHGPSRVMSKSKAELSVFGIFLMFYIPE